VIVTADNEFEVVVVGFGAAGAYAAIAAAESGARVLVVDRSVWL
jgi:3-oxo-5alpha-steroid 4-dehydrogenase